MTTERTTDRGDVMDTTAPSKRGTNPRGIELKDELRRKLAVAQAEAAYHQGLLAETLDRLDDTIGRIDDDMVRVYAKGVGLGALLGGVVGALVAQVVG